MKKSGTWVLIGVLIVGVVCGLIAGAYLFTETQRRPVFNLRACLEAECMSEKELNGLFTSVGLNKMPGFLPTPIFESDKIVVVHYPDSNAPFHEVVFPKKDIRDISQLSDGDQEYVWAAMTYIAESVKRNHLQKYRVVTNGPYFQKTTYLHFHLIDFGGATSTPRAIESTQ